MRSPWIVRVALNPVTTVLIRDTNAEQKSRKDRAEPGAVASSPGTPGAHSSGERQGSALRHLILDLWPQDWERISLLSSAPARGHLSRLLQHPRAKASASPSARPCQDLGAPGGPPRQHRDLRPPRRDLERGRKWNGRWAGTRSGLRPGQQGPHPPSRAGRRPLGGLEQVSGLRASAATECHGDEDGRGRGRLWRSARQQHLARPPGPRARPPPRPAGPPRACPGRSPPARSPRWSGPCRP